MADHDMWLKRLAELEASIRTFIRDARSEDRPEPVDALSDVLDVIRDELFEDSRASRWAVLGRPVRELPPFLRPVAAMVEKCLQRAAFFSDWTAAGLRLRLKQVG